MTIPRHSELFDYVQGAYFADSFSREIPYRNQTALDIYLEVATQTPSWISFLMEMRNRVVSMFGLKHLGRFQDAASGYSAANVKIGERLGIFTLLSNKEHEIVLEDSDKHLDVRVSFLLDVIGDKVTVHATTVVHVHNLFGKAYMFIVAPIHKVIVPSSLKILAQA
ncbi:DUF2867 domain-containing protein [Vibrio cholerae]|uniref:DUF2867 domain-containing protein n=1 Tax=Vibrio cholerae TaxID=666 RepID=UPI000E0A0F96|nr:DUF2867 domain-containing protein [Vibrio cholerae]MDV2391148.1 DUF2867 domain-containing protein [Vibrio cholerae]HBK7236266.1 DUF2867 domain-containing protein [Vibrio cholerae]HBK7239904.1 DUF2867 domain-containing protein [Vibrio cholerae]